MNFFSLIPILYFSCKFIYEFVHVSVMFRHEYLEDIFYTKAGAHILTEWNVRKKEILMIFFFSVNTSNLQKDPL